MQPKLIALCRHFSGLSQTRVAERLGVAQSNVCRYENGLQKPNTETVQKMKELFKIHGIGIEQIELLQKVLETKLK